MSHFPGLKIISSNVLSSFALTITNSGSSLEFHFLFPFPKDLLVNTSQKMLCVLSLLDSQINNCVQMPINSTEMDPVLSTPIHIPSHEHRDYNQSVLLA